MITSPHFCEIQVEHIRPCGKNVHILRQTGWDTKNVSIRILLLLFGGRPRFHAWILVFYLMLKVTM